LPPLAAAQLRDCVLGQLLLLAPPLGALLVCQLAAFRRSHPAPPLDLGAPASCGACAAKPHPQGCDSQAARPRSPARLAGLGDRAVVGVVVRYAARGGFRLLVLVACVGGAVRLIAGRGAGVVCLVGGK
jgi:hypothetical protein